MEEERRSESFAVGVFENHKDSYEAVTQLKKAGFDMLGVSIIGKDYPTEEFVVGYYRSDGEVQYWGKHREFWMEIWTLLHQSAFFWFPGVGPILVAGPLVSSIAGMLSEAAYFGGATALSAGLFNMGIPKTNVTHYQNMIKGGHFVLMVRCSGNEMEKAREILRNCNSFESVEAFGSLEEKAPKREGRDEVDEVNQAMMRVKSEEYFQHPFTIARMTDHNVRGKKRA